MPQTAIAAAFYNPDTEDLALTMSVYQIRKLLARAQGEQADEGAGLPRSGPFAG
ncbi:hypothetical protein [Nonomuraea sp. NPDC049695]|uniref:hypothetical protein n=1 Tax=Nonomuraea sp. NPDC049695 TaxID=3154734 RepID=UPI00341FC12E